VKNRHAKEVQTQALSLVFSYYTIVSRVNKKPSGKMKSDIARGDPLMFIFLKCDKRTVP
jgi:hypothetical protein